MQNKLHCEGTTFINITHIRTLQLLHSIQEPIQLQIPSHCPLVYMFTKSILLLLTENPVLRVCCLRTMRIFLSLSINPHEGKVSVPLLHFMAVVECLLAAISNLSSTLSSKAFSHLYFSVSKRKIIVDIKCLNKQFQLKTGLFLLGLYMGDQICCWSKLIYLNIRSKFCRTWHLNLHLFPLATLGH